MIDTVLANITKNCDSISGRVIPKTLKSVKSV